MVQIIRDTPDLLYTSWDSLINEFIKKGVNNPEITTEELIEDLKQIKSVSHGSFFTNPQIVYISNLLNQVRYYRDGERFSFVEDIHWIALLITELKKHPNSEHLFKKGIFTNFGFFSQFLLSCWMNKFLTVEDFELNNPPVNTDILVIEGTTKVHFHIKDIREEERADRLTDLCLYIDSYLTEVARQKSSEERLAVISVEGVPPRGLPDNFWTNWAAKLDYLEQEQTVSFEPGDGYGNSDTIDTKIKIGWRPFSGIFESPTNSFNNEMRANSEYEKFASKVKGNKEDVHILVLATEDKYSESSIREALEGQSLGLMTVEVFDFSFERSSIFMPYQSDAVSKIEEKLPKYSEFSL